MSRMNDDEQRITDDVSALLSEAAKVRQRKKTPTATRPPTSKQVKQTLKQERAEARAVKRRAAQELKELKTSKAAKSVDVKSGVKDEHANKNDSQLTEQKPKAKKRAPRKKKPAPPKSTAPVEQLASSAMRPVGDMTETGLPVMAIVAILAMTVSLACSVAAWKRAPAPGPLVDVEQPPEVPAQVLRSWITTYPLHEQLRDNPDANYLTGFANHLAKQSTVSEVVRVGIDWKTRRQGNQQVPKRTLAWQVELRKPVLPVRLISGELRWVDNEGVLLPGALIGPEGLPVVVNYEASQRLDGSSPALMVVLEIWDELSRKLSTVPGLEIDHIDLAHDLGQQSEQLGIVLTTNHGTKLIWGRADENRFGVDWPERIDQLCHALRCQGDLSQVAVVNARFTEPFTIVR